MAQRQVPGLPEAMRAAGLAKTPHAMLYPGGGGAPGRTLIVNLPGSLKGATGRPGAPSFRPCPTPWRIRGQPGRVRRRLRTVFGFRKQYTSDISGRQSFLSCPSVVCPCCLRLSPGRPLPSVWPGVHHGWPSREESAPKGMVCQNLGKICFFRRSHAITPMISAFGSENRNLRGFSPAKEVLKPIFYTAVSRAAA